MHSRVFNLDVTVYDEDEVYFMLKSICSYVDYVDKQTNLTEDLNWLSNCHNLEIENEMITITEDFAKSHWDTLFKKAEKLIKDGLDFNVLYTLKRTLFDETGFMFIFENEMYTFDGFMKAKAQGYIEQDDFNVNNSYDYHF